MTKKPRVRHSGTPSERFWKRVEKSQGCWLWTGLTLGKGYGAFSDGTRRVLAHRFSYEEANGPIPEGYQIDHACHVRTCVNPGHLRLVTNKQNMENPAGLRADNSSGHRGVFLEKKTGRWRARAQHHGKQHNCPGSFDTPEEAAEAAKALRLSLFTHNDADRNPK